MKKEIESFNPVVCNVSTLVELDDEQLDAVVGGYARDVEECPTNNACEPNCHGLCTNLA
ncbi:hypothetical protein [Hyalangium versicolor]|uniref:hypothetical protein n=1 Tax=Hyalangium versicolor TaxID=2861190 RepID=UPI001CCC5181|nr:hypothetical protein [Hyalangium versicolor]